MIGAIGAEEIAPHLGKLFFAVTGQRFAALMGETLLVLFDKEAPEMRIPGQLFCPLVQSRLEFGNSFAEGIVQKIPSFSQR